MTNRELITLLQTYDLDMDIKIDVLDQHNNWNGTEIIGTCVNEDAPTLLCLCAELV